MHRELSQLRQRFIKHFASVYSQSCQLYLEGDQVEGLRLHREHLLSIDKAVDFAERLSKSPHLLQDDSDSEAGAGAEDGIEGPDRKVSASGRTGSSSSSSSSRQQSMTINRGHHLLISTLLPSLGSYRLLNK